jgi:hypothetical protein
MGRRVAALPPGAQREGLGEAQAGGGGRGRRVAGPARVAGYGLALFTLFSPELGLWVGTFHVILQ